jgi:hypothetical protein
MKKRMAMGLLRLIMRVEADPSAMLIAVISLKRQS